ncbi:MAG TPA: T9SS type A sorting domain-containing protein [Bacteroidia bacterium]|jgi:hypothetical protein|nr:T9SS type A sorting domain-containing protein [Bacteroidia bacterium]
MRHLYIIALFFGLTLVLNSSTYGQDTLRVMTYNVLHYGDGCQGSNTFLHSQLKTIVEYTNPDILGLVKAQAIKVTPTDNNGVSPYGFADSIATFALNAAYPSKYNYCPLTNYSASNDMDVLFYNQNKLGFVSVTSLCTLSEDFNLYKLFYKDPYLNTTHDSTFLYVILNHTVSGTSPTGRDQQDTVIINELKTAFYHLPNLISMGDFNTHSSLETGYQRYTNASDTSFLFYDAPFNPDNKLTYPLNWESTPNLCPGYLNTTTRASASIPNSCGTNGGAKDWFIHIFFSGWMVKNTDFIKYINNSYTTIGNDGKRLGISENDSVTNGKNTSAPSNVINAIFQLSDKYPIMLSLAVSYDSLGNGPVNPVNGVATINSPLWNVSINNPVHDNMTIHFSDNLIGKKAIISLYDVCGRCILANKEYLVNEAELQLQDKVTSGLYFLRVQIEHCSTVLKIIKQ